MRTFLLTIFWITNLGNVIQLLIMASASWIIFSGAYSFFDLNVNVFITQYIPMFIWIKTFIVRFWVISDTGYSQYRFSSSLH